MYNPMLSALLYAEKLNAHDNHHNGRSLGLFWHQSDDFHYLRLMPFAYLGAQMSLAHNVIDYGYLFLCK